MIGSSFQFYFSPFDFLKIVFLYFSMHGAFVSMTCVMGFKTYLSYNFQAKPEDQLVASLESQVRLVDLD
jgi:hypothetical protein